MTETQRGVDGESTAPVHVLARACAVLDVISARQGACRLADLGRELDLAKTTLHRLVTALEAERMVRFDTSGRLWLGARLMTMGRAANEALIGRARPVLERLAQATGETVDLSVLDGRRALFVDQIPSQHRLRAVSSVGATFPLHCSANGKSMLGLMDDDDAVELASPLERFTPATITTPAALCRELAAVRSAGGVASDREEHTTGISASGIAVRAANGQIVAVSVPAPTERYEATLDTIATAVRAAGRELASILGAPA